ncbi:Callose synthase [Thalictrum thalictroides]|uniref:Callose synthase n=1 Tax=Thalictrum thalictroides TaxID=46969 RepID=A0A7J6V0E1_THATH|nr:Callose synthase [Thalictrum thalictroides]
MLLNLMIIKRRLRWFLSQENISSLASRVKRSDAREIESFYQQYYENYVRSLNKGQHGDRTQLAKTYQTTGVLFDVLCAVNKNEKNEEVAPEEMNEIYAPYNILPLDPAGASQPIMQFDEVSLDAMFPFIVL